MKQQGGYNEEKYKKINVRMLKQAEFDLQNHQQSMSWTYDRTQLCTCKIICPR